ncbi:hypothetical protein IEQ34_020027 [Dendrobium chrysotoxum]|uniref:Uncharacterized protein n=1 Tax=Dendrobium chrysotoxum TaxID=161865 RepID=A0AAV7GAL1_DENCH|nr:hypothetical protein IEQ34_020027 [Dendrobium chrysotoxum]
MEDIMKASNFLEIDGVTNASKVTPIVPHQKNDKRKLSKLIEDVVSNVTSEALAMIRRKFYLPNEESGIVIPKFLCRAITIIVGITIFFREHGVTLKIKHLSRMFKFTMGASRNLRKLIVLSKSSHVKEEEILKLLNFFDTKTLRWELCFISRYVAEEKLFKVGLSI